MLYNIYLLKNVGLINICPWSAEIVIVLPSICVRNLRELFTLRGYRYIFSMYVQCAIACYLNEKKKQFHFFFCCKFDNSVRQLLRYLLCVQKTSVPLGFFASIVSVIAPPTGYLNPQRWIQDNWRQQVIFLHI